VGVRANASENWRGAMKILSEKRRKRMKTTQTRTQPMMALSESDAKAFSRWQRCLDFQIGSSKEGGGEGGGGRRHKKWI